jgi:uncharacterized Tic20 family protein
MSEETPPLSPTPPPADPLSPPLPPAALPNLVPANPDEKNMGMLAHLLGIFTFFLGPLVIWLIKKDQSKYIEAQSKEALNFQITASIALAACSILLIIPFVGCLMLIVVLAAHVGRLVLSILGTAAANKGEMYRYPLTLRLLT